jgi:hypothetical protein
MTPEEIRALLAESKQLGLTGATLRDMQSQMSTPAKKLATQKKLHMQEMLDQAQTGMQPTLGPLGMVLPGMGLLADLALFAIGAGKELGQAYQQGYLSNQNFANMAMASLGFGARPLIGRKGEGKLYSRLLEDLHGLGDAELNPTMLGKFLKKGKYASEEIKFLQPEQFLGLKASEAAGKMHEQLGQRIVGKINSKRKPYPEEPDENAFINSDDYHQAIIDYHAEIAAQGAMYAGGKPLLAPSDKYMNNTFPEIQDAMAKAKGQDYMLEDSYRPLLMPQTILMDTPETNLKLVEHWGTGYGNRGDIHARTALTGDHANPTGILAEVQSDAWKSLTPKDEAPVLRNYEQIGSRQGLLALMQQSLDYNPNADMNLVWPSGHLQQIVNGNKTSAYNTVYDKKLMKSIRGVLGDDAHIAELNPQLAVTRVQSRPAPDYPYYYARAEARDAYLKERGLTAIYEHNDLPGIRSWKDEISHELLDPAAFKEFIALQDKWTNDIMRPEGTGRLPNNPEHERAYVRFKDATRERLSNHAIDYRKFKNELSKTLGSASSVTDRIEPVDIKIDWSAIDQSIAHAFQSLTGETIPQTNTQGILREQLASDILHKAKLAGAVSTPDTRDLYQTTIPNTKLKRLATEGIPLWMLPIGAGLGAMQYNKEDPYAHSIQP